MKRKKFMGRIGVLTGMGLLACSLAGCAETPENPAVWPKREDVAENYKEAEVSETGVNGSGIPDSGDARGSNPGIDLYTVLAAPETYQSEVSDTTGKLKVYTDAVVELPKASKVSAVSVRPHSFGQAEMELVTKTFFDDAQVYDAGTYTERTKEEWQAGIEGLKGEMKRVEPPFPFREELIDPFFPELGSIKSFYGIVPMGDGNYYRYEMVKSNSTPMQVFIKKVNDLSNMEESRSSLWTDYVSMKTLYSWLPDEDKLVSDIGISMEDAKKISDEKVSRLNLEGMEMTVSEYAVEIGGHNGAPGPEDLKNAGYCFHYTRKLNGIPITYTTERGGFREKADSGIKPWCYEALDIYVTKDGIDTVSFLNQYEIGETKAGNLELMPFSEIIAIYEKMMTIQNAGVLMDQRGSGGDVGAPMEARTYRVDRIVFGYSRIYDSQAGGSAGLLVPVWDFFGEYENDFGEGGKTGGTLVREKYNSFLTINAVDGTVINRESGY